ncbi:MAG: hypothetical protein WD603_00295 [Patescibacteria group bacterium]
MRFPERIRRLSTAALGGLFVMLSLGLAAEPVSAAPADSLACPDGKTEDYRFQPRSFPDDPDKVRPESLGVTVGDITFTFNALKHHDRGGGLDSWDFFFKPDGTGSGGLTFLFRNDPGNGGGFGYVVDGPPGEGLEPANKVCNLIDFHKTPIGEFLKDRSNAEGIAWAEEGGAATDVEQTSLLDRASDDPFAKALAKMAEVVSSLSGSVTDALLWAMDVGNFNENRGLAEGWKVVRDVVNLIFILVLSGLALSSIIRIEPQKYNVRQLLPLLVFSILAVNFSFLFANILANTAFVLSQPFAEHAKDMIQSWSGVGSGFASGLADGFGEGVVLLLASIIILVALLVLLFFFIVRVVVIWVLAVLSPALFLFLVLPFTRGESRNLLQTYIRWVYMAPVAFLLLFVGSLMLEAILTGADTGRSGATAIIQALFFAGIVIAAVAVPLALGGRVASMAAGQGKRAGGIGGKGGLGAVGMLPGPGGKTIGQRGRETKAFFKQRKDSQEQDAMLSAAHNRIAMAEAFNQLGPSGTGLTRTLTGMSQGQQVAALESMVNQAQKEMIPLSISAKNRIAHGYKYGTVQEGGRYFANHSSGDPNQRMEMDATEHALAQNRINSAAAFKELAQAEYVDEHMLQGPKNFAWTGYQQLHKGDPLISSYERSGDRINFGSLDIKTQLMDSDTLRGMDTNVLQGALSGDGRYLRVMRNLDGVRLSEASDATARNKFHSAQKQRLAYEVARQGLLSSSVNRADFKTGAEYQAEVAKQQGTESAVVKKYQDGRRSLGLPFDHPTL